MKDPSEGGSRIALIMNGSPLFTGDAGSGESEIRRWVLENDWLETLIALPEQLFYNTGIATYVWILTNRKAPERKGKVQLIDATSLWSSMRKSLGDKRREITPGHMDEILALRHAFDEGERSKIFPTTQFGFRKVQIERPLRLNFEASEERIAGLAEERAFQNLGKSKKKNPEVRAREEAEGRAEQERIRQMLGTLPGERFMDRVDFLKGLKKSARSRDVKLAAPVKKAILSALGERDEAAAICRDKKGNPEPDTDLRDHEVVPLGEDLFEFVEREVKPWVPDAWIDEAYRDALDGGIGRVGYEINFNRFFYQYTPPRPLEEIDAEIRGVEEEILELLGGVAR
jgi:type I restriction enzyme M protein